MQVINWATEESFFKQDILLGDRPFTMAATWNTRSETWAISLSTNTGEMLVENKTLAINTDILNGVHSENKPQGYFVVTPVTPIVVPITQSNMGIDILLMFIGFDEIL
jgi:hypothetical protein